jgi:hypothetical protein
MNYFLRVFCVLVALGISVVSSLGQETPKPDPAPAKSNKNISAKYDKGKDLTTVKLKEMTLSTLQDARKQVVDIPTHEMYMSGEFSYSGTAVKEQVETLKLTFREVSRAYFFLKGQQIVVALDPDDTERGRAIDLGFTNYKSDVQFNSAYQEFMTLVLPFTALDKITKAKAVTLYVGQIPYRLTDKQIQNLRDFGAGMLP